jgi:hypothetical protein
MTPDPSPARTEQELLERYAALAYDRQTDLYEVIGDSAWNADMDAGTISFGPERVFPLQALGTFSHASETWRWAWVAADADWPARLLSQAAQLRAYGEQHGIDLLAVGEFDATPQDLHAIGAIASGMFGASGYYLANYGQGTLVLTLKSAQIDQLPKNDFARIPTVFSQVISAFELRHRPAFLHYLAQKGYPATETADAVSTPVGAGTLTATFDDLDRLSSLRGDSSS